MKACSQCKAKKPLSEFNKRAKSKDGLHAACKCCIKLRNNFYKKTRDGVATSIYGNQRESSRRRGHLMPTYTLAELKSWLFDQPSFEQLYNNWVDSGYSKMLVPSADRINDSEGYSISNIQLMTWEENSAKAYADKRAGRLTNSVHPHKAVLQSTKDGDFIAEFPSVHEAARQLAVSPSNVSECCHGVRKSASGYKWEFKNKEKDGK